QMRFNCAKAFYIYSEPRGAILEGTRYGGAKVDPYHMKAEPSLSVGLGYRILTGSARHDGSVDYKPIKDDNIFFGAGVGAWAALRDILHPNIDGHAYFGKMLSTASGLQITGAGGARPYKGSTRHYVFGTLDYVLDFDNALTGYRPDRVVNIQGNFGVGGACVLRDDHTTTIAPAFSAGLTALFKVAPNWAITIHPQAYVSSRKFFNELNSMRPVITSLDLGLRYTIGDFSRNYPDSYEDLADEGKRWFVTAGVGASKRFRYDQGVGGDVFIGFGRQITPVSSYRVAVTGVYYPQKPSAFDATIGIDYLASISTAMKGYDPTRLFDLQLLAGVQVGAANIDHSTEVTAGVKAGLQGNFRLNDRLDLFITPHVLASRLPVQGKSGAFVPELRCNVGVAYRLGK
ncbi:MAG: hypothetical protein K2N10_05675, partial [Muribaculaceae bacterium]|nr:hypothetical protein [Muribaculaceae bacterium]